MAGVVFLLSRIRCDRIEVHKPRMAIQWRDSQRFSVNPKDPGFYQNPYQFYREMHEHGGPVFWEEYDLWCLVEFDAFRKTATCGL